MPKVTFIEINGSEHVVDAQENASLMQTALDNGVPGIIGDCGGNCSCATCHVYVDEAWLAKLQPPSAQEREMIDCALNIRPNSRLCCQIAVSTALEGLVVRLPASQI